MPSEALRALYDGDSERARALLALDEELSVFDAAAFGRVDRLRELLAADSAAGSAVSDDGFTPLHLVAFTGEVEAARILIQHGAPLDVVSTASFAQVTPLGTAAFARAHEVARILLEAGADPKGGAGTAPLATATANGDEELVQLLRVYGCAD